MIAAFTGQRPKGWLSPGLRESHDTPEFLKQEGIEYVFDWVVDDVPNWMHTRHGPLLSLPYNLEINDSIIYAVEKHSSPEMYLRLENTLRLFERDGSLWAGLLAGRSGAAPITKFDPARLGVRFACEVKGFDPLDWLEKKELKKVDRFIQFELRGANAGQEGKLVVPEGRYLIDLGQKLLAIAVRSGVAAKKLAVDLKSTQVAGIDSRIIECYAVPAAMLAVAEGVDHAAATAILHRLLANVDKAEQGRIDHEDLIGDIMAANVNLGGRGVLTVGQILESPSYRADYSARLEAAGVKVIPDEYGNDQSLFIVPKAVSQHLLRGGAWEGQNLAQIVMRTPGAARTRLRVGGANQRGVAIPITVISLTRSEF